MRMTGLERSGWYDYAAGAFVFCLLISSGTAVVLYGRFDFAVLLFVTGIAACIAAILHARRRQEQNGRLFKVLAVAVLLAAAGTGLTTVLCDALIHGATFNPEPPGSINGPAKPWLPPDAELLGNELNDTAALLREPVGGFEDGRIFVSSYYPEGYANYTLLTRNMTPTTVELRVFSVDAARSSVAHEPYEDLEVTLDPDRFAVVPGRSYTARFRVNLTSGRYDDTLMLLPYYVQVRSADGTQLIADDWVLVYAGGHSCRG